METVKRHAIFWTMIYILWTYMKSGTFYYTPTYLVNVVNVGIYMTAYYTLKKTQIPLLYNQGRIVLFVLSLVATSLIFYILWHYICVYWISQLPDINYKERPMRFSRFLVQTAQFYSPGMALLAWDTHRARIEELERMRALEKEKLMTELKFLKAQLNPHFLFNTLNNLYAYVVTGSPKAPDMILRLSGILDYVLYRSQHKTVALSEEVNTIEHFLSLEQIRYGDRLHVNYEKSGNMSLPISPLILLSMVENAFKHGASGDIDQPKIDIQISTTDDAIHCKVWNTKSQYDGELNDAYKEGIGLSNIKRQLNLIYPNQYQLEIDDQSNSFNISLTIETNI